MPNHWALSSCDPVEYCSHHIELIEGLLLSDGTVTDNPPNSKFQIGSTNKEFLDWLQSAFGVFSGTVNLSESAADIAERNKNTEFSTNADLELYNDYYRFRTMASEKLNPIRDAWYTDGKKSIPDNFKLTPRKLKMWYVGDGSLRHKHKDRSCRVSISNSTFEDNRCIKILQEINIDASSSSSNDHILLSVENTERFFRYVGAPVPGFQYKWPETK
jgi:hypothetical protein